jgi:nitrogen regulatory protein PII-like uncharacterized protein
MADFSRIVSTTINKHLRETEPAILRNRKLTALLQKKGRVKMNCSGKAMDWRVEYKRIPIEAYGDMDIVNFSRNDRWKVAELDWRGYSVADAVSKKEKLVNKNMEAIVKIYTDASEHLIEDMQEQFAEELYVDGYATGNSNRICGLESFMGQSGVASSRIATASDTYAGLRTDLGFYGGNAASNWPDGVTDAHADFFTPVLVDCTDAAWSAATKTFAANAIEQLRYGIIAAQRNASKQGQLDLILLDRAMYRDLLEAMDAKERLNVQRNDSGLWSVGFTDMVMLDGVEITSEYGIPLTNSAPAGYGLNLDKLQLCSLQGQLFMADMPDYDVSRKVDRLSVDFFGNLKCQSPRYFVKWANYT